MLRRLFVVVLLVLVAWVAWEALTWPDVANLARHPPTTTAFIERWQEATGRRVNLKSTWVPYAAISPSLKVAVLVAEDINFFSHNGFDAGEIAKALDKAIDEREMPRGASTVTQQLAKNLWLSPSRDPLRKAREAVLTWQLERSLSKRRILEIYLNVAEFGPSAWGAESAGRRYFGKAAAELNDDEAAALAASLPSPSTWYPGSARPGYRKHVERVRRRMDKAQFLRRQI